jgi:hypothetical protein
MPVQQKSENHERDRERQRHQDNDQHFEARCRERLRQPPDAGKDNHGGAKAHKLADSDISLIRANPSIESGE